MYIFSFKYFFISNKLNNHHSFFLQTAFSTMYNYHIRLECKKMHVHLHASITVLLFFFMFLNVAKSFKSYPDTTNLANENH
jgi:hypothetical protein